MLPGFRILFAMVFLSVGLLVFGLGAISLLRTAHNNLASQPSWRAPTEVVIAPPADRQTSVLALLRVDPPAPPAEALRGSAARPDDAGATSEVAANPPVSQPPVAAENEATDLARSAPTPETATAIQPVDVPSANQTIAALAKAEDEHAQPGTASSETVVPSADSKSAATIQDGVPSAAPSQAAAPDAQIAAAIASAAQATNDTAPVAASESPAAAEPRTQLSALPADASATNDVTTVEKPAATDIQLGKQRVRDLRAERRARARIRARRLAIARARAARLAQIRQQGINGTATLNSSPNNSPFMPPTLR